jgi:hypothetical protein
VPLKVSLHISCARPNINTLLQLYGWTLLKWNKQDAIHKFKRWVSSLEHETLYTNDTIWNYKTCS